MHVQHALIVMMLCLICVVLQGWRLDPLLLFGQLLTAGAALSFGVEALRLREIVYKKEVALVHSMLFITCCMHLPFVFHHLLIKSPRLLSGQNGLIFLLITACLPAAIRSQCI